MNWGDYATVGLMGLLGGAHCAGMCAPFALAVSIGTHHRARALFLRHTAYQAGKATAYMSLCLGLRLATGWANLIPSLERLQDWLALAAGVVMIATGLGYLVPWRPAPVVNWLSQTASGAWTKRSCGALSALWNAPSLWSALLTGWINGFMPCGLSLAALLFLASRDSVVTAVAGSYVFGLGTMPALLVTGWLGGRVSSQARGRWLRIAGALLVLAGLFTLFRGSAVVNEWIPCHPAPPGELCRGTG